MNSFRESIEWLDQEYVANRYRGQIITDFDEQQGHFRDAPFSLTKVMNLQLQLSDLAPLARQLDIDPRRILSRQDYLRVEIGELYMGPKYNITGGNQGAVGDNASAQNFTQMWNGIGGDIDLPTLKEQLSRLRQEARSLAETRDQDAAVVAIGDAEAAAAAGDGPTVLEHLAKTGKWAFDVATKIGVSVAAAALKSAMGMP